MHCERRGSISKNCARHSATHVWPAESQPSEATHAAQRSIACALLDDAQRPVPIIASKPAMASARHVPSVLAVQPVLLSTLIRRLSA